MLTISRSVDRVFQIIQLFTEKRRGLSATEIRNALNIPHSSSISVLARLTSLGYLEQNPDTRRFYPSLKLHRLCDAMPRTVVGGSPYATLADSVHATLNETTSVSRLHDMFTLPVYSRAGTHVDSVRVIPGLSGGLATQSVSGRALLSMLPDAEIDRLLDRSSYWARRARVDATHDRDQIMRSVQSVREHGYLCGQNLLLPGVGAVSCPLPLMDDGEQLVITVVGTARRIEQASQQVIRTLMREVANSGARTVTPRPRMPSASSPFPSVHAG